MKKIALVAVFVFVLLCPLAAGTDVNVSESESLITFSLNLDKPIENVTYSNEMPLDFSVQIKYKQDTSTMGLYGFYAGFKIDNDTIEWLGSDRSHHELLDITTLSDGLHNLTIYAGMNYGYRTYYDNGTSEYFHFYNVREFHSQFLVSNTSPKVQILSPQNTTYFTSEVPLAYDLFLPSSFGHYFVSGSRYSLDNQANQTVGAYHDPKNGTLTNLADGAHSLTVYGIFRSLETSDTVYFTIDTKSSPTLSATVPEFPAWMLLPLTVTLTVVMALIATIVTKRKKLKQS